MEKMIVYTEKGHSYQFQNVSNVKVMNTFLEFDYVGVRSGKKTKATFINIAGYTIAKGDK